MKTYAIDWDGTIVKNGSFPSIGEIKPNFINVAKRIIDNGDRIIIWTCRGGKEQYKAITDKLNENGITDFLINEDYPDIKKRFKDQSPKVFADIYIDDRGLFSNGIDWYEIEKILFPSKNMTYGDLFEKFNNLS